MKKAYIETEYNDYNITAQGFVISGEVFNMHYVLEDVPESEYPSDDELENLEDHLKSELLESIYNAELRF